MSVVIVLCLDQFPWEEVNWPLLGCSVPIWHLLAQYAWDCASWSVDFHMSFSLSLKMGEYWDLQECVFQLLESFYCFFADLYLHALLLLLCAAASGRIWPFLGQFGQRQRDSGEALNESSIVVHEANEYTHVVYSAWDWPFFDGLDPVFVNSNSFWWNNVAKVFCALSVLLALWKFHK